jgi:flavin reductase (DIM6/NTAB) family NADH-FMN oxidoreductase RutF
MPDRFFDFALLRAIERYKLLCGIVVPRPIALVTSLDASGRVNAAPFSFFNVFSEDPAQVVLGLQHNAGNALKDTSRNIARAQAFVVNMVDEPLAELMNLCATDFPPEISEIEALGIDTAPCRHIAVPRITAAPFALECKRTVSLAFTDTRELLIGEVLAIHARDGLVEPASFYVDTNAYRPIGRLAGAAYCRQGDVFQMKRISYEMWRQRRDRSADAR